MELKCAVQSYAWGIKGLSSSVAQLARGASPDICIEPSTPYAELWMGTHCNGPSIIKETGGALSTYINDNPDVLGSNITSNFGDNLSFLFKVLSVNQALSIQAHPNKSHAEKLHASRPEVYKDPNHKPELAIALTPFQALCGFRPAEELISFIKELPELREVIGEEAANAFVNNPSKDTLKKCFSALMYSPKDTVASAIDLLAQRLQETDEEKADYLLRNTFLTLLKSYPGDGGCFAIYLLNFIELQPGEALFLGPNMIHAYLLGDCMECMACSDNVVRAGLTPKYQDVETLISMLEYDMRSAESNKFQGVILNDTTTLFNPPVPDFSVQMINVKISERISLTSEASASILIVIEGEGDDVDVDVSSTPLNHLKRGSVIFFAAQQTLSFVASDNFLAFRAFCSS